MRWSGAIEGAPSGCGEGFELCDDALEGGLGVAVEHAAVGTEEEGVFEAGEAGALAALETKTVRASWALMMGMP